MLLNWSLLSCLIFWVVYDFVPFNVKAILNFGSETIY